MYEHQKRCLRRVLTSDLDGNLPYSLVVWSDIKKSAKSCIAAAVALAMAWHIDNAEIYIIANDLKQADSRVAMYFRRALDLNPMLRGSTRQRGYRTFFGHNRSFVEAIPIDPSGEAGSNADLIIYSELWGAHEKAKSRMWVELTLSPTKFGKSMRWVETYAGYLNESKTLYGLYQDGVENGRRIWDDPIPTNFDGDQLLEAFENEAGRMFCLWNTYPRLPFQTAEYYASEEIALKSKVGEFDRVHRNKWVSSQDTFVPLEWWTACEDAELPPLKKGEPVVLAADAAVTKDSFSLLATSRHPTHSEDTCVRYARRWLPPKGGRINFQGTPENPGPEMEIERLLNEMNVVQLAYDPTQLEDMMGRLRRKRSVWAKPFDQGVKRLIADEALRDRIMERRIHHSGEPDLQEHIKNADAKVDTTERKIRIVKKEGGGHIDLAVCLSMADFEAMRLNLFKR